MKFKQPKGDYELVFVSDTKSLITKRGKAGGLDEFFTDLKLPVGVYGVLFEESEGCYYIEAAEEPDDKYFGPYREYIVYDHGFKQLSGFCDILEDMLPTLKELGDSCLIPVTLVPLCEL